MRAQNQLKSKVFQNPSQSTPECQKFWREFCRLSKNHQGQAIRCEPHFNTKVAFQLKHGSRVQRKNRDFTPGLSNSVSHAGLSNSVPCVSRGSEQLCVRGYNKQHEVCV